MTSKEVMLNRVRNSFPVPHETGNEKPGLRLTALPALLSEPPEEVEWQWAGLMVTGGTSLLAAKPKTGKSTLARAHAIQTARGGTLLGRACRQGPVLYIGIEEKRARLAAIYRQMPDPPAELFLHIGPPPADPVDALYRAVCEIKPVLVWIDPVLKFISVKDSNDYAIMSAALAPIEAIARESGAHIALSHHMGKMDREDGDQVLGSTAIFAGVDTVLTMRKSDTKRTLSSVQRFGDDMEPQIIELDDYGVPRSAGSVEGYELRKASDSILTWLEANPDSPEKDIRESVEGKTQTLNKALHLLVDEDKVSRAGSGKRGSPFTYSVSRFVVPSSPLGGRTGNENLQQTAPPSPASDSNQLWDEISEVMHRDN